MLFYDIREEDEGKGHNVWKAVYGTLCEYQGFG